MGTEFVDEHVREDDESSCKKHKHGRPFDLSSESSLQFPKSLCQTLAKQFLVKDRWVSVLGILEHLHPNEDERPLNPSASSHEAPMEVDREVDVPPPALPPSALPPTAPLVDAGPNSSERKEITNWLQKIHQQIGHRDNRTLVRLLKQRGTHPWVLKMATEHRCSACDESRPPALRHVTCSYENVPGAILQIDGMHWQHPVTGSSCSMSVHWLMLAHVLR